MVAQAEPFDYEQAKRIAGGAVRRYPSLAKATGQDFRDLVDELAGDIWKATVSAKSPFDPGKASISTFGHKVAWGRMVDKAKSRGRFSPELQTAEWADDGEDAAKRGGGDISQFSFSATDEEPECVPAAQNRYRGGRLGYGFAVLVRAYDAKVRSGMGWRAFHRALIEDSDKAREMGFKNGVPSCRTLIRAKRRAMAAARAMKRAQKKTPGQRGER